MITAPASFSPRDRSHLLCRRRRLLVRSILLVLLSSGNHVVTSAFPSEEANNADEQGLDFLQYNSSHGGNLRGLIASTTGGGGGRLQVGRDIAKKILLNPSSSSAPNPNDNDIQPTVSNNGKTFIYLIEEPGATYLSLHMQRIQLSDGCTMTYSSSAASNNHQQQVEYQTSGKGRFGMEHDVWLEHIDGDAVQLKVDCEQPPRGFQFAMDKYAAGYANPSSSTSDTNDERRRATRNLAICGADDKEDVECYNNNNYATEYDRSNAVAKLLIEGKFHCTGFLVSPTSQLLTAAHCLLTEQEALNTDYTFLFQRDSCGSHSMKTGETVVMGSVLELRDDGLDYALVQIPTGDPAVSFGFLEIDNRKASRDEEIYIPQHPNGKPKEFAMTTDNAGGQHCTITNVRAPNCKGSGYKDLGYSCDTEPGSSGSPVLARSSHKVIGLHHCGPCPENRAVPMDRICNVVCPLLSTSGDGGGPNGGDGGDTGGGGGSGTCGDNKATCSANSDCCSNNCKGGTCKGGR